MARGPLALHRWISLNLSLFVLFFVHAAHCFYLPGVAPQDFKNVRVLYVCMYTCAVVESRVGSLVAFFGSLCRLGNCERFILNFDFLEKIIASIIDLIFV